MILTISVKSNLDQLSKELDAISSKQLPFATALAITRTAYDAQKEIVLDMPTRFVLRRTWITKGVLVDQATKSTLKARVYDRDAFMVKQEEGGTQVTISGKRYLAIPMPDAKRTKSDVISARDLIKNLGKFNSPGSNAFIIDAKDGRKYVAVRDRPGKRVGGRNGAARSAGVRLIWELRATAKYNEKFGFVETAQKVVNERFSQNFSDALEKAIRTAR